MNRDTLSRRTFLYQAGLWGAAGLAWSFPPLRLFAAVDLPKPGAADWPRFGCDLHNTRFNSKENAIGPANVDRRKVKWTFDTLDHWIIYETPAVVGDSVFFGAGRYAYVLESATGKLKWKFDWVANGEWESAVAGENIAMAGTRSSQQYYEGRIYFGSPSCAVY